MRQYIKIEVQTDREYKNTRNIWIGCFLFELVQFLQWSRSYLLAISLWLIIDWLGKAFSLLLFFFSFQFFALWPATFLGQSKKLTLMPNDVIAQFAVGFVLFLFNSLFIFFFLFYFVFYYWNSRVKKLVA